MPRQLSRVFIEAFVERCYDLGLTKEATAQLLVDESWNNALRSPAFLKGVAEVADPDSFRVSRVEGPFLEKKAFSNSSFGPGSGGFGDPLAPVTTPMKMHAALGANYNENSPMHGGISEDFKNYGRTFRSHPVISGAAPIVPIAGGLGYNANRHFNQVSDWVQKPRFMRSGWQQFKNQVGDWWNGREHSKYDFRVPSHSQKGYDLYMRQQSNDVAKLNTSLTQDKARLAEIQQQIAAGAPGSDKLIYEQQQLQGRIGSNQGILDRNTKLLQAHRKDLGGAISDVERRQARLDRRQNAWYAAPLRWMDKATGHDNYTAQAAALQQERAKFMNQRNAGDTLLNRMQNGWTRHQAGYNTPQDVPTTDAEIQKRYFTPLQ